MYVRVRYVYTIKIHIGIKENHVHCIEKKKPLERKSTTFHTNVGTTLLSSSKPFIKKKKTIGCIEYIKNLFILVFHAAGKIGFLISSCNIV